MLGSAGFDCEKYEVEDERIILADVGSISLILKRVVEHTESAAHYQLGASLDRRSLHAEQNLLSAFAPDPCPYLSVLLRVMPSFAKRSIKPLQPIPAQVASVDNSLSLAGGRNNELRLVVGSSARERSWPGRHWSR